jgi:hypothetical protein
VLTPSGGRTFLLQDGENSKTQTVSITNGGGGKFTGFTATIVYGSTGSGWLTADLVWWSDSAKLTLTAQRGSLAPGTYLAKVVITAPGASNSPLELAVRLGISAPPPSIVLMPAVPRNYTLSAGESTKSESIAVTNGGGGTLSGLATSITYGTATGWLQAQLTSTTAPTNLTLTVSRGSLAPGVYQAIVSISATNADTKNLLVQLTIESASPAIDVSVTARSFNAMERGTNPAAQQAQIGNSGGGMLSGLTVTENPAASWLTVTLSSTTAPATMTFQVTTGALAAGTYTTTVTVASPVAGNTASVAVTFTVAAAPPPAPARIVLSNHLTAGGADQVLRFRVARTDALLFSAANTGAERLSPDSYCESLPGESIGPGESREFDVAGFAPNYVVYIGLGKWDNGDGEGQTCWSKKNWGADANSNMVYIYAHLTITGHSGTMSWTLTYSGDNIVLRTGSGDIGLLASVNRDPIQ